MSELPLVSILIPLYNHEKFIENTLESIKKDKYKQKEVLIINDGSNDNSHEIVLKWIEKNKKEINVIYKYRENKGVRITLNELISLSKGKYIIQFSSDDYLINNTISERVKILENNPSKLMLIADAIVVDDDDNKIFDSANFQLHSGKKENYFSDKTLKKEILYNWSVVGPVYMVNKRIYDKIGYYDPEIYLEDWDYAVRTISKNAILFFDEKVAAYRLHENNTIKNKDAAIKFSESCIKTIEKHGNKFSLKDRLRLWNKARKLKRKVKRLKNGN
ncbi:hypothetical protein GCM10012288_13420 [Malaciobacter pacificus]|uniref:Glycosyltransferase, family 2 n=1 Tax=Malaciobacter pacificus TaxID=1080223 RepID=A0A5C2HEK8_9BACT|nr:glycosyltransferase family 2 protein [Malaciobacter pacificus]QEP34822.1 glycosyltransferase, family 2 [Malaciobacter pacificus]GGD40677.1 hypothetical protein GCM10012288_13420 [Malaciobacter pacificus]